MKKTGDPLKKLIASNLYSRYSDILSLSNISLLLVDTNGDILLEFIPSPDYCKYVCQKNENCICSDYISRFKSGKEGRFVCRHGLENILLPISEKGKTVGYIVGMQVYLQDTEYQSYMIDMSAIAADKDLEMEFIAKSISALKTVESKKIEIHEQMCGHIAKNLSFELSENVSSDDKDIAKLSIEKEILEKKIIDLEAKNMSLVINPHFLFNTLNCIARIAYFENSHMTEELIYCLSDLLRYNLRHEDQLQTIGSEIDNIEKYLYIQKVRFKNRLEYNIDIPEHIKTYRIPYMVIQPIVENSLIHGITPKRDGGKINISAEKYKNEIIISIMDNGNGFPQEVLKNIQKSENTSGLGFRGTDKRLKRYYGERYGLKIVKSDYSGSTVIITIPTSPL
jgi:sensor histidine kinase YesM